MSGNEDRTFSPASSRPRSRDREAFGHGEAANGQNGTSTVRTWGSVKQPQQPILQRTGTNVSTHAETSLRRMATHETGGYDHDEHDSVRTNTERDGEEERKKLERHSEDHHELEATSSERHEESRVETHGQGEAGSGQGKKPVVLQDQTNLLPVRQVIFVFLGLTCAIFCSLLDQTM